MANMPVAILHCAKYTYHSDKKIHGKNTDGLQAVFFAGLASMAFCQAYQLRMKSLFFFGLFIAFFVVYWAVRYVLATM